MKACFGFVDGNIIISGHDLCFWCEGIRYQSAKAQYESRELGGVSLWCIYSGFRTDQGMMDRDIIGIWPQNLGERESGPQDKYLL